VSRPANPVSLPLAGYRPAHFLLSVEDKVATVTLNRPERKNPLTFESYRELADFFFACQKDEAAAPVVAAPVAAPTTDDKAAWNTYLQDLVPRHMEGIANSPYIYRVPSQVNPQDPEEYNRLLEKAKLDTARGIVKGNMLAYAGLDPAKTADLVVEAFKDVAPNTMAGVRVVYIGDTANNERVKAAVAPAGVEYVFVEAK
jgi:hypothetical protein